MQYYVSRKIPACENPARAQSLMQKPMKRLKKEVYLILRSNWEQLHPELVSVRGGSIVASSRSDRSYARALTLSGLGDSEVIDSGGEIETSMEISKLDSDVAESKIKTWLYIVKLAVKTLFNGQRQLCDHVFSSSSWIKYACFIKIVRDGPHNLFGFMENIAMEISITKEISKIYVLGGGVHPLSRYVMKYISVVTISAYSGIS
ncbi:Exocyst complex component EXO70H1 [Linum grandiflorum]